MLASAIPAALAALLSQAQSQSQSRPPAAPDAAGALHALIINGGGSADDNFKSHLLHVREMAAVLADAGVPRAHISILASDGADPRPDVAVRATDPPDFWLLHGTGLERWLEEPVRFENTTVPGMAVAPATRGEIARWFQGARARLRPGDTLLIYVTDHGKDHPRDPRNNSITLWGRDGLTVRQLTAELARLPVGVRVVAVMSQCFSGGFAHLMDVRAGAGGLPSGTACGYFASTANRPAFGCYPEAGGADRTGHGFAVIDALASSGGLRGAHARVLVRDLSPDVPLRTVDTFLAGQLRRAASREGADPAAFIDNQLARAAVYDELARAGWVAEAFGIERPATLAAAADLRAQLTRDRKQAEALRKLWQTALEDMTLALYQRLLAEQPQWSPRLRPRQLRQLADQPRRALTAQLLRALGQAADRQPGDRQRLDELVDKADAAAEVIQRLDAREAALLRIEVLLTTAAGRAFLAARGTGAERDALAALDACEDLTLPVTPGLAADPRAPVRPPPWPGPAEDRKLLARLHPSWLGIAFQGVSPGARARFGLGDGAALVTGVQPGSPADSAGLIPGDIVVGQVGAPFERVNQIRSFTMLSPAGKPLELEALRRGARRVVRVTLAAYPVGERGR